MDAQKTSIIEIENAKADGNQKATSIKNEEFVIENFFRCKYDEFYTSYNKILEILKLKKKNVFSRQNPLIISNSENNEEEKLKTLSNENNLDLVFNSLENLYFLIKANANFFNFTKNIISKLEKINFFDEVLLFLFKHLKKGSLNFKSDKQPTSSEEASSLNKRSEKIKNLVFFILIFIKFKVKSRVKIFEFFGLNQENQDLFKLIFEEITNSRLIDLDYFEREIKIGFFILCYQNLEIKYIAQNCLKYVSFFLWVRLSKETLKRLLIENEKYIEKWKILLKLNKKEKILEQKPSYYFNDLIDDFLFLLENENNVFFDYSQNPENFIEHNTDDTCVDINKYRRPSFIFYEKFIELIIDLLTQISTRKFILPLLREKHFIERIKITKFYLLNDENTLSYLPEAEIKARLASQTEKERKMDLYNFYSYKLFTKMVDNCKSFIDFQFDENSHENLTYEKIIMMHYECINKMQALAYELFPDKISKFYLKSVSHIDNRENLELLLENLTDEEIILFLSKLNLLNLNNFSEEFYLKNKKLLNEIFVNKYERKSILLESLMETPLYPNEELLLDSNLIPLDNKMQNELYEIYVENLNQKNTNNNMNNLSQSVLTVDLEENENLKSLDLLKYKNNNYFVEKPYPIPKLNLQFLTNFDYLFRNFILFKFESTYEIRQDIQDVIDRIHPVFDEKGCLKDFDGWSRMAVPIKSFKILVAKKPKIGKKYSEVIVADVEFSLGGIQPHIKNEWDKIKKHDILFLITFELKNKKINSPLEMNKQENLEEETIENEKDINDTTNPSYKKDIEYSKNNSTKGLKNKKNKSKYMLDIVKSIRGCEVNFLYDNENNEFSELESMQNKKKSGPVGVNRRVQVILDGIQYNQDLKASDNNIEEIYSSFHLLVRRKPKENNFRAILETIRDLMNETTVIPKWMENIFLGFGDPTTADYKKLNNFNETKIDFLDTFLNAEHFQESFIDNEEIPKALRDRMQQPELIPKFLKLEKLKNNPNHVYEILKKIDRLETINLLQAKNPSEEIRRNKIKFTKKQIEAIVSGVHCGLTTVVGPPGTGKTDVAVQLVSLIYHNFPNQRTIVVTHSNTALNDIFEKISKLDINERYLLRLGIGEKELSENLEKDFSRFGRINFMLERRIDLLSKVLKIAQSIDVYTHEEYTCENAILFYEFHIISRIKEFKNKLLQKINFDFDKDFTNQDGNTITGINSNPNDEEKIKFLMETFPFTKYFKENLFSDCTLSSEVQANPNGSIFASNDFQTEIKKVNTLIEYIEALFTEISEVRAFELLRNNIERGNYLLTKQAKVIAMTCTHAALKRREFIKLGFEYDNIIVEEAAQILEVETFIPLLLQSCDRYKESRLKRVILIGDDNQLPPIVKHSTYKNYSKLDQSLFNRFVRTGIPYIKLDAQGRTRYFIF